jgi:competence protein ComEA
MIGRGPPLGKVRRDIQAVASVSTAIAVEPEALPGIGPVFAGRIIESRPYRSVDDLERVKAIGMKRLEEIRPLVTAE